MSALRDVPGKPTRDDWLAKGGRPELRARSHLDQWAERNIGRVMAPDVDAFTLYEFLERTGISIRAIAAGLGLSHQALSRRLARVGLSTPWGQGRRRA